MRKMKVYKDGWKLSDLTTTLRNSILVRTAIVKGFLYKILISRDIINQINTEEDLRR